jgi:hypothetical protein
MKKSVGQVPTAGKQTQQKPCRTSSDIGAELENHTVGRDPVYDRKGLTQNTYARTSAKTMDDENIEILIISNYFLIMSMAHIMLKNG